GRQSARSRRNERMASQSLKQGFGDDLHAAAIDYPVPERETQTRVGELRLVKHGEPVGRRGVIAFTKVSTLRPAPTAPRPRSSVCHVLTGRLVAISAGTATMLPL